eukprot:1153278-Pelagomonas_calceolata.AAC.2
MTHRWLVTTLRPSYTSPYLPCDGVQERGAQDDDDGDDDGDDELRVGVNVLALEYLTQLAL